MKFKPGRLPPELRYDNRPQTKNLTKPDSCAHDFNMRSNRGLAYLELLFAATILFALAWFFLKQRQTETAQFGKAMQAAGVEIAPGADPKSAENIEKAVERQLNAATEQRERDLQKSSELGNQ